MLKDPKFMLIVITITTILLITDNNHTESSTRIKTGFPILVVWVH